MWLSKAYRSKKIFWSNVWMFLRILILVNSQEKIMTGSICMSRHDFGDFHTFTSWKWTYEANLTILFVFTVKLNLVHRIVYLVCFYVFNMARQLFDSIQKKHFWNVLEMRLESVHNFNGGSGIKMAHSTRSQSSAVPHHWKGLYWHYL